MILRQSLQNKYSYVYRKTTCMQKDHFTCNQNKMANYSWAYLCSSTRNSSLNIRSNCVFTSNFLFIFLRHCVLKAFNLTIPTIGQNQLNLRHFRHFFDKYKHTHFFIKHMLFSNYFTFLPSLLYSTSILKIIAHSFFSRITFIFEHFSSS